ncbi:MAG TPA: restriction endonuclease [Candidatus Babeliales bacterium]|nr:restriction endonuclease [Candidatus Babeliales bacterium]
MSFTIEKASGEIEEFDLEKFRRSITRPGASPELIEKLVKKAQKKLSEFKTSEDVFRFAFEQLKEEEPQIAARYNLKRCMLEFGPTGFPFEQFVAEIFKAQQYQTETNQIVKGWCVDHEIDLIAKKDNESFMVECKFHNQLGNKSHVQVPLYTEARFHDIQKTWKPDSPEHKLTHTWVVTNTTFTYEALKYSNCVGIKLTSWDYPKEENLAQLIVKFKLYPITAIISLTSAQKKLFIKEGFTLAKDVEKNRDILKKSGMSDSEISGLIQECNLLCGCVAPKLRPK